MSLNKTDFKNNVVHDFEKKKEDPILFRMGFGISKQVTISERHKEKYR